jgi:hypothetical protein
MCASILDRIHAWLGRANGIGDRADLIFVLAGRQSRKRYGLQLLREQKAPSLLLSVARFDVRRTAQLDIPAQIDLRKMAAAMPASQRHFFLLVANGGCSAERIRTGRLGTLSEIKALAEWLLDRPSLRSILIVTSGSHVRRVRLCCGKLLSNGLQFHIITVPAEMAEEEHGWSRAANLFAELGKLVAYWLVLLPRRARA